MATEIERKFLVSGPGWRERAEPGRALRQAYLTQDGRAAVRVRIVDDAKAYLTIKGATKGRVRAEFEYEIPVEDARALFALRAGQAVEKRRYIVRNGAERWEIDVFEGAHEGLVIAEIELPSEDAPFARPDWLGAEVTEDPRYYNANLAAASADDIRALREDR